LNCPSKYNFAAGGLDLIRVALAHPKRKKKAMLDAIILFIGYLLNPEMGDIGSKAFSSTPNSPHFTVSFIKAQCEQHGVSDFLDHPHPRPPPSNGEGNKEGHTAVGA